MLATKEELAADFKPTEEKMSGYYLNGKEVVLAKRRGRPRKQRNKAWFPQDQKVEACTLYAVYGNVEEVERLTGIPANAIRQWKQEPWWIEILKQIYVEQNEGLGAKLNHILDNTLTHLQERLENGDYIYDSRQGEFKRKPVDTKVLAMLFENLAVQRRLTRGEPTSISAAIGVEDRLKQMEEAFVKFSKAKQIEQVKDEEDA